MQQTPQQLKIKLIEALDEDNNVVNMAQVLEVISTLETYNITRQALEQTRIGRHINELRKKTSDSNLAKRAKCLVRNWQKFLQPSMDNSTINSSNARDKRTIAKTSSPACRLPGSHCTNNSADSSKVASEKSRVSLSCKKLSHLTPSSSAHTCKPNSPTTRLQEASHVPSKFPVNHPSVCDNNVLTPHPVLRLQTNHHQRSQPLWKAQDASRKRHHSNSDDQVDIPTKIAALIPSKSSKRRYKKYKEKINGAVGHSYKQSTDSTLKVDDQTELANKTYSNSIDSEKNKLPKVKTTAEIIASLQKNANLSSSIGTGIDLIEREVDDINRRVVPEEVLPRSRKKENLLLPESKPSSKMSKTKTELVEKFLETSLPAADLSPVKVDPSPEPSPSQLDPPQIESTLAQSLDATNDRFISTDAVEPMLLQSGGCDASLTLQQLFEQLPPLNINEINYDDGYSEVIAPSLGDDSDIDRLHNGQWPMVNGIFDYAQTWHSWTEPVTILSYNHEPLHILPYVVIDKFPPPSDD